MLRFVDQADAARIFVERTRVFHRTRHAVERQSFRFRMRLSPFGKRATNAAVGSYVEPGREFAHVVQNQETAGRECGVPKIELSQSRSILMRAVQNDQLGIAAEIFPGCFY